MRTGTGREVLWEGDVSLSETQPQGHNPQGEVAGDVTVSVSDICVVKESQPLRL